MMSQVVVLLLPPRMLEGILLPVCKRIKNLALVSFGLDVAGTKLPFWSAKVTFTAMPVSGTPATPLLMVIVASNACHIQPERHECEVFYSFADRQQYSFEHSWRQQ